MGLIRCEQCGYDVSTEATHCPHCKTPVVLFKLKDSLSRKKSRNLSSDKPSEKADKVKTSDKEKKPTTNTSKTSSPNIFDTIRSFKEENKNSAGTEKAQEKTEKPPPKITTENIVKEYQPDENLHNKSESFVRKDKVKEHIQETAEKLPQTSAKSNDIPHGAQAKTVVPGAFNKSVLEKKGRPKMSNSKYVLFFGIIITIAVLGFFMFNRSDNTSNQEKEQQKKSEHFNKNRQKIIDEINTELNKNNYGNAQNIAREYLYLNDPDINKMYVKARKEFLMIEISKLPMRWDNFKLPDSLPSDNKKIKLYIDIKQYYREKRRIYEELAKIDPANKEYKEKYQHFSIKYNEIDTKFAELNKRRAAEKKRKESIESQFSRVDGSHKNLEKYLKSKMKYPDSFRHIKSAYEDRGNLLIVATTYQGKDIYEQVVIKTVKARVGLDGKVLGIISEY